MTDVRGRRLASTLIASLALLALPIRAQMSGVGAEDAEQEATRTGWHVVRVGETLYGISALYLGASGRWPELAAINPQIGDPHRIEPGQRLKVLLLPDLPPRTALLVDFVNKVESLLNPLPWDRSQVLEILRSADALRTFENASASLRFSDRNALTVTEETLVFLRSAGPQVSRREASQIEIRVGQADYAARAATADDDIEIVIGAASATPRPDAAGTARTRARVDRTQQAQVMVYDGSSELTATSGRVSLAAGTGTSVSAEGRAAPPERLLAAPRLVDPADGSAVPAARARFRWQAVAGATAYVVEICRDPGCARLVRRETGLDQPSWQVAGLPTGRLHWRATAVSASGLDGFPSATAGFESSARPPDEEAPWATVRFRGPQVTIPNRFLVGRGTAIEVATGDDGDGGVASWSAAIDGSSVAPAALAGPWAIGGHHLDVEVVDDAGNRFAHRPVPFTYDPEPPILRWGRTSRAVDGETQGVEADSGDRTPTASRPLRFEWAPGVDRSWRPMRGHEGVPKVAPTLGIRPARGSYRLGGTDIVIARRQPLWLAAEDPLCRAVHLSAQILADPDRGPRLVVDAVDLLGNVTRAVWPLLGDGRAGSVGP